MFFIFFEFDIMFIRKGLPYEKYKKMASKHTYHF